MSKHEERDHWSRYCDMTETRRRRAISAATALERMRAEKAKP